MKLLTDTRIVFGQQIRNTLRTPSWLVLGIVQPLVYLGLFVPVLRGALGVPTYAEAYALFVPGVLVLLLTGASAYAGLGIVNDVRTGAIARCQVTSISRVALLLGRVLNDMVSFLFQALVVLGVALACGMRPDVIGMLASLGLLCLMSGTLSAISYSIALRAKHEASMSGMIQLLTLPVLMLSGIMLPLTYAPGWLQAVADANPLAYVVTGTRDLFDGRLATADVRTAVLVAVCTAAVGIALSGRRFATQLR